MPEVGDCATQVGSPGAAAPDYHEGVRALIERRAPMFGRDDSDQPG